jgi:GMP synthase (glutamine-hydrolysing)
MMHQLGGRIEGGTSREFGRAYIERMQADPFLDGLFEGEEEQVWMSHGDHVAEMAPGFTVIAKSPGAPYAVIADTKRRFYGTQFHPEKSSARGVAFVRAFLDFASSVRTPV